MLDDDETILHDRPHKDPGRARAAKVVRARKLAKEISEMSDEAVEVAVEKYFVKNPCNEIKVGVRDYYDLRSLYEGVISRINKLEDDTRAAIEFADLAEDDRGTEMILEFCDDITKLVGE